MRLDTFKKGSFDRGRPLWIETLWILIQSLLISTWIPGSSWRCLLLRAFGAQVGKGVTIKPGVRVKFPWRLTIGDHSWIGERVWLDNLASIEIGSHCCISQGAYLCTGSHDWSAPSFDLIIKPISVENHAWIAARATVAPGVRVGEGAVLSLGSTATKDLMPWSVYQGNPALFVRERAEKEEIHGER